MSRLRKSLLIMIMIVSIFASHSFTVVSAKSIGGNRNVANHLQGDGSQTNPLLISTIDDYNELAQNVLDGHDYSGEYIKLTANIGNENESVTVALGDNNNMFAGNLDGDGHSIYVDITNDRGLINKCGNNTVIKNLTIEGRISFSGNDNYTGAFAGTMSSGGLIDNCINRATVNGNVAGGLVGFLYGSTISNSVNYGNVTGNVAYNPYTGLISTENAGGNGVGGIVGTIDAANPSSIINCSNFGAVTSNNQAGGIVGKARTNADTSIANCINYGEVKATDSASSHGVVGGIIGMAGCNVSGCANRGNVEGVYQVGGVVGALLEGGKVNACLNVGQVVGLNDYVGGIVGFAYKDVTTGSVTNCFQQRDGVKKVDTNPTALVGSSSNYSGWITGKQNKANTTTVSGDNACKKVDILGSGTEDDPYLISDIIDYNYIADSVINGNKYSGKYIAITADIGSVDEPVTKALGTYTKFFGGNLDGNNHTIYLNLTADRGLINKTDTNTTIKNITIEGSVNYTGTNSYVGGLAGVVSFGSYIENCINRATINGKVSGGVIGYSYGSIIKDCKNYGDVQGEVNFDITATAGNGVGGIVGTTDGKNPSTITGCINYGNITSDNNAGGIVGKIRFNENTVIENCVNGSETISPIVNTTATDEGGLAGGITSYSANSITNCVNYGTINTSSKTGSAGIVAYFAGPELVDCINYGNVSGTTVYTTSVNSGYGIGGIAGTLENTTASVIRGCKNFGEISSNNNAGGIVGKARANSESSIINCLNEGTISVNDDSSNNGVAGGIVGMAGVNILSSTNYGTINGTSQVGGIVGALVYGGTTVDACHNFGSVNASKSIVGGIVGYSYNAVDDGSIINCVQHFDNVKKASASPTDLVYPSSPNYSGWILGRGTKADAVISGDDACTKVDLYGYGTETNPFTISNLTDWNNFAKNVTNDGYDFAGTYVSLNENIGDSLNSVTTIVGNNDNRFTGTFDGLNHTIYLSINLNSGVDTGAFSGIAGIVKNLVIDGSIVNQANNSRVGGVAGRIISGHIENCVNKANVLGNYYVGGIVGLSDVEPSYILNCSNYGDISGAKFVGGITGYYQAIGDQINTYTVKEYINSDEYNEVLYDCTEKYASIINCVNYGTIMADGEAYVGGIAGVITKTTNANTDSGSTVIGCLNYGEVQGTNNVAGIVGWAYQNTPTSGVDYCYNFTPDIKIGEAVASKIKVTTSTTVSDSHLAYIACYSQGQANDIGSHVNNFVNYEISINSASATIAADGSLILNVYSIPKDNIDTETAYVKVNDVSTLVKDLEIDNKGRFIVSTPDLEPVYMTNDFSIQYFDANDNPLSREVTMSIQDYLMNFYNGSDAGLKSLAKSMLNYGSYCQLLFNINTDSLANSTLVETDKDVSSVVANIDDIKTNGGQTEGVTPLGFSLVLNNKTDLKLYLNIDGDVNEYKAYIDGEEAELVRDSGSRYFVRISNVAAPQLNEKHNITLTHNETGDLYINCSLLSYAYSVINKAETTYANNQNLVNAMRAMYAYHNSARDLFN